MKLNGKSWMKCGSHEVLPMKPLLIVLPIIILAGCNGAARNPQVGSMVHPETDLTQFTDEHLLRYYYFFTQFVANQESVKGGAKV